MSEKAGYISPEDSLLLSRHFKAKIFWYALTAKGTTYKFPTGDPNRVKFVAWLNLYSIPHTQTEGAGTEVTILAEDHAPQYYVLRELIDEIINTEALCSIKGKI